MTLSTRRPIRHGALAVMMIVLAACSGGEPTQDEPGPTMAAGFGLPTDGELPGWSLVTDPEHYEADNLWEYINGQADFFIDYGFVRVDTAEYRNDHESSSVVLEVYRMGRPQEAFGIFAAERTRDDRPLEIGAGAYLGANVLGFWQGERYVKLTSFDEGPAIEQLLIGLAEEISSRIPGQGHELETLLLFLKRAAWRRASASSRKTSSVSRISPMHSGSTIPLTASRSSSSSSKPGHQRRHNPTSLASRTSIADRFKHR